MGPYSHFVGSLRTQCRFASARSQLPARYGCHAAILVVPIPHSPTLALCIGYLLFLSCMHVIILIHKQANPAEHRVSQHIHRAVKSCGVQMLELFHLLTTLPHTVGRQDQRLLSWLIYSVILASIRHPSIMTSNGLWVTARNVKHTMPREPDEMWHNVEVDLLAKIATHMTRPYYYPTNSWEIAMF